LTVLKRREEACGSVDRDTASAWLCESRTTFCFTYVGETCFVVSTCCSVLCIGACTARLIDGVPHGFGALLDTVAASAALVGTTECTVFCIGAGARVLVNSVPPVIRAADGDALLKLTHNLASAG